MYRSIPHQTNIQDCIIPLLRSCISDWKQQETTWPKKSLSWFQEHFSNPVYFIANNVSSEVQTAAYVQQQTRPDWNFIILVRDCECGKSIVVIHCRTWLWQGNRMGFHSGPIKITSACMFAQTHQLISLLSPPTPLPKKPIHILIPAGQEVYLQDGDMWE